ncbi:hypothetical protein ASD51_31490 [Streptomyces sp. Root55]|uniref:hypothetical protein n=1 Tax=Streptomyces sp. Root55 TaxID=1736554 RepID=UPI0006F2DBDE|nr:hypothetical protein [Streptomyces sp. Root55]KQZ17704.1 hypothetical protein ASD51_31490 [Streptomyces sp. Root55]
MKAGRPQGGPKGQSEQANALAVFLQNLTKGLTVRELAELYKSAGGRTLWGEYRSGTKTVHLHLLESLVHDTVRDARSRTELLARARRLHAEAVAAQQPAAPAEPDHVHQGVSPEQAVGQATTTLQDAERLIHILLGVIAGLQMQAAPTGSTGVAGPVPLTAAQSTQVAGDLREAQDRLVQVRLVHDAVTRVRDEAVAFLPAPDPTGTEQIPGGRGRGDDTALPARYAAASRGAAAILLVSRAALAEQHNAARMLSARTAGVGTVLYGVETSSTSVVALPPAVSSEALGGPQSRGRSSRWRTVLVATAAAVALTAVVSGAVVVTTLGMRNHESPQAAAQEKSPGPAAAAPHSSPAPSLSPSPTATATPSPTPSTGLSSLPAPARTRSTSTVPDRYVGVWEGEFTEPGEQAPSLRRIVVRKGTVGTKIADVITLSRTSLCQAEGTLRSTGTLLVITPRPTSGTPAHLCTPAGDIALRRDGDAGLTWKSDGITVPLHRASSHSAVPTAYVGTWRAQDGNDPTSTVRMTIRQGVPGTARAEFTWDGDAHHCEGFSVLASAGDTLAFGPETVTASEPEGFCSQTPSRTMTRPDNGSMHVEMAAPDGTAPRAFTFTRAN